MLLCRTIQRVGFLIFVVGPAGIGKTTITKRWREEGGVGRVIHLEFHAARLAVQRGLIERPWAPELVSKVGLPGLYDFGIEALALLKVKNILVDFGAGFQTSPKAPDLIASNPSICLYAEPEIAFARHLERRATVNAQRYLSTEYSERRRRVYEAARHVIDTSGLGVDETLAQFTRLVAAIRSGDGGAGAPPAV